MVIPEKRLVSCFRDFYRSFSKKKIILSFLPKILREICFSGPVAYVKNNPRQAVNDLVEDNKKEGNTNGFFSRWYDRLAPIGASIAAAVAPEKHKSLVKSVFSFFSKKAIGF